MSAGSDASEHCLRRRCHQHGVSVFSFYYGNAGLKVPKRIRRAPKIEGTADRFAHVSINGAALWLAVENIHRNQVRVRI